MKRPKLTLRQLCVIVAGSALASAFLGSSLRLKELRRVVRNDLQERGGRITAWKEDKGFWSILPVSWRPSVCNVKLKDCSVNENDLERLDQLGYRIVSLDLTGTGISDGDLAQIKALASFSHLRDIGLARTRVTAAAVKEFEHSRPSCAVHGDDDLPSLQHFDQIKSLNVSSTNLTDGAIEHVLKLRSVRELDLVFTRITGAGIRELGAHPNLTTIHVWHDQLDENGLAGLQDMENLTQVYLWVPDFGDEDKLLPPKIKRARRARPDVDVDVMWYVDPMHGF